MDIEKLKPWNWFKHENDTAAQAPVSKQQATGTLPHDPNTSPPSLAPLPTAGSLLKLHHEMDRLFDNLWRSFGLSSTSGFPHHSALLANSVFDNPAHGIYRATLDVAGNAEEYEVSIDLPGLTEDDVKIELSGNALTIHGTKEETHENKEKQYYRVERSVGTFQRTLSLPEDTNAEGIVATLKNGVLVLKIPRKTLPKADVKHIAISS